MGTFDWFRNLIEPIGELLQQDRRFSHVAVFYDRSDDRQPPASTMPCINYFLQAPWEDQSRGAGATSISNRRSNVRLGFGIWVSHQNPAELDRQLFGLSSDLMDFFYERRDFDPIKGIFILDPLSWNVDYSGGENGYVGTQLVVVNFEALLAP